eukprot:170193-Pyramimonas_sp.AAC.2
MSIPSVMQRLCLQTAGKVRCESMMGPASSARIGGHHPKRASRVYWSAPMRSMRVVTKAKKKDSDNEMVLLGEKGASNI